MKKDQARALLARQKTLSDWDTDSEKGQNWTTDTSIRLPSTLPRVLTLGKGRGYPLANWNSVVKG